MRELNFASGLHPTTLRREIKRMYHLHSRELMRVQLKVMMEEAMGEVVAEQLQALPYERTSGRRDRRNGGYARSFLAICGLVRLRVPRTRMYESPFKVIERAYRQREVELDEIIRWVFLNGLSTRDVGRFMELITGHRVSASTVSSVTAKMEAEVRAFHSRGIADEYAYLILDGVRLRFRSATGSVHRLVLCAVGIRESGEKEFIDFLITRSESESHWQSFLVDLFNRGLEGKSLRLVVTDGNKGLINALTVLYPRVPRQRCCAHKMRNVASKLPRSIQKECMGEIKALYGARTRREAVGIAKAWANKWKTKASASVRCLMEDLDDLLVYLDMPEKDWKRVRTTNIIEREFREVRRRVRPMTIFANNKSCERILVSIFTKANSRWKKRRSLKTNLTQLS
jgi:putative transposase